MPEARFPHTAGVIDIGSNTIKMLTAFNKDGQVEVLDEHTCETRISQGISKNQPTLREDRMNIAVEAIVELHERMRPHQPECIRIVATSAVRDASNRAVFIDKVRQATQLEVEVIAGKEEARLIAKGIATDRNLQEVDDFMVMDMGGGSVEIIRISHGEVQFAESLPLGCVRVMENCITDPSLPLSDSEALNIGKAVNRAIEGHALKPDNPGIILGVGTGGTFTTARAMLAHHRGNDLYHTDPYISLGEMKDVFAKSAGMTLEERYAMPKLPKNRADVFPCALLTLISLAEHAGIQRFYHSFRNLRFGVMAEVLGI